MTNNLPDFGIDMSELKHDMPLVDFPEPTPGRIVHIDADFLAYQVSYDDEKSFDEMQHNCDTAVERIRKQAGATASVLHITPKGSTKGNRFDIALLKEYQASRKDKVKPKLLHAVREWLHKERGAILHHKVEADDGMAIAQYAALARGDRNLSIIATKDKDLTMVPGLLLDWDTGQISDTEDDFGYIRLDDSNPKTKKIRGRGWKYFWAQMLTGDAADNISGLPKCATPEYLTNGKHKLVGAVLAYQILQPLKTNKEAFTVVRGLYKDCGEAGYLVGYKDGKPVPWGNAFVSEAQLLWMRRNEADNDVIKWWHETCR